ncbi:integrase core domain-containing protein [Saccharothrix sp. HUAS TT1]|uniref:integrase core domain-containing protein n=1 Tax=Saccharothrix sp. HUAS TT1 TaxID=3231910 RepID=UPI00345C367C
MGLPPNPGRAAQARPPDSRLNRPPRAQAPASTARTPARHRHLLATVLARRRPRACRPAVSSTSTARWRSSGLRVLRDGSRRPGRRLPVLIRGRAGQFTTSFDAVFSDSGIQVAWIPPRCPRADARAERFVGTVRREAADRLLILDERHLRSVLQHYVARYRAARRYIADQSSTA